MNTGGFDVGSIVGHLILDKEQWRQAISSAQGDLKNLQQSVRLKSDEIQAAGRVLVGFGASVTATFGLLIKNTADAGDHINDLSKRTGIATELLSGYKLAADKSGSSLDGFAIGIKMLANQMQAAHDQGGASKKTFDDLGVSFQDGEKKLRPLDKVMLDVADKFKAMPDGAAKSALAVDLFGKSGSELIPLLNLGRAGLEAEYAAAERLGQVFSKQAAQGADDFNDSLTELKAAVQGVGNELGKSLLPALKPLIDRTKESVRMVRDFVKEYPALSASLAELGIGLGVVATVLGTVAILLPSFLKGWVVLLPLLTAIAPVVLTIGSLWAGYKFGEWIGHITGLNATYQSLFGTLFKGLGIIKDVNIEFGKDHAAAHAIQVEAIARASELAGRKVSGFIEAQRILRQEFAQAGTVGNAVLDGWLQRLPPLTTKVGTLKDGITALLATFNLKGRTELTKELETAEAALKQLRASTESTPGAIKALEDIIADLRTQLQGASVDCQTLSDRFNVLDDDLRMLRSLGSINISAPVAGTLGTLGDMVGGGLGDVINYVEKGEGVFEGLKTKAVVATKGIKAEAINPLKDAFQGLYNDIATGFADALEGLFDGTKKFADFFTSIWQSIKKAFFRVLGEMVAGFLVTFVKQIIGGMSLINSLSSALKIGGSLAGAAGAGAAGVGVGAVGGAVGETMTVGAAGAAPIAAGFAGVIDTAAAGGILAGMSGTAVLGAVGFAAVWLGKVFGTLFGKTAAEKMYDSWAAKMKQEYGTNWEAFMRHDITHGSLKDTTPSPGAVVEHGAAKKISGGGAHQAGSEGNVHLTFQISALDGADVNRVVRQQIIPILRRASANRGFLTPTSAVGGA